MSSKSVSTCNDIRLISCPSNWCGCPSGKCFEGIRTHRFFMTWYGGWYQHPGIRWDPGVSKVLHCF